MQCKACEHMPYTCYIICVVRKKKMLERTAEMDLYLRKVNIPLLYSQTYTKHVTVYIQIVHDLVVHTLHDLITNIYHLQSLKIVFD